MGEVVKMGQYDVLEFLKKKWDEGNKEFYSSKEISEAIGMKAVLGCSKLRRFGLVDFQEGIGGHRNRLGYRFRPGKKKSV